MAQKVPGSSRAVGHWSRNLHCRIGQEAVSDKVKALLQDKLVAMGRPVELWLPVGEADTGVVACTCDKNTRPGSDYKCLSCFGTRFAPGYRRFLHETLFASSAQYDDFTLTGVERDLTIKPNRLRLLRTGLTGTIVTPAQAYANPRSADWTFQVVAFRKTSTDTILAEFSTDGGTTWTNIININGSAKPIGTGTLRFRVTLTRAAITTDSPDFEILRVQHRQPDRMTRQSQARSRDQLLPGQVWLLKTWVIEQTLRQAGLGRGTEFQNDHSWTAPLDFYDTAITRDTPAAKIDDREAGPHPMFEHAFGIDSGQRFAIFQLSYNEQLLTFTHQSFAERRTQSGELYGLIF